MSYWNYRVIKRKLPDGTHSFGIHEVYYNVKNEIEMYSENPEQIVGETLKELHETCEHMAASLYKPVLIEGNIKLVNANESQEKI
jgi:hypothetical protein